MLISCPNCKTTFAIPAKAVGATGKKVKCSKCAHVWLQPPLQIDKAQLDSLLKVEYKPTTNLPTKYKPKIKYAYVATLIVLVVLCVAVQMFKSPENYSIITQQFGLDDYEGLRFHNFKVDSEIVDNRVDFYLKGTIVNTSDRRIKLPAMNVRVLSTGGRQMAKSQLKLEKDYIEPFESINISPEITKISGNADKIELTFENWAEATFR